MRTPETSPANRCLCTGTAPFGTMNRGTMNRPSLVCAALVVLGGCASPALVEFRPATATMKRTGGDAAAPSWTQEIEVGSTVVISNADIASATASTTGNGKRAVAITMTEEGARRLLAYTSAHLEQPIAILLDGQLLSAPTVRSPLSKYGMVMATPDGLSEAQVDRIVRSINRR